MGVVLAENENELESLIAKLIQDLEYASPTYEIRGYHVFAVYRRPAKTASEILGALRRNIKADGLDPLRRSVVERLPWGMRVERVELWPHPEYPYAVHIDLVGPYDGNGGDIESVGLIILPPERAGVGKLTVLVPRAFYTAYVSGEAVEKYVRLYERVAATTCNVKNCLVKTLDATSRKYAEMRYRFCSRLAGGQPGAT